MCSICPASIDELLPLSFFDQFYPYLHCALGNEVLRKEIADNGQLNCLCKFGLSWFDDTDSYLHASKLARPCHTGPLFYPSLQ